jgi:large subunit ribosomal protein L24
VHPIKDPKTGIIKDVIISQLARGLVKWDRRTGYKTWRRYVPGLNITIPWPERDVPEPKETPADTKRDDFEATTFIPTLLTPPIPEAVIDELRNRFSKFRTRHEPWYIAKKEAEEAEKHARNKGADYMLTPLEELHRQQRAARKALGQPQLSDEMLEKIGRVIAKNKAAALSAAGMSQVQNPSAALLDPLIPAPGSIPEHHPPPQ